MPSPGIFAFALAIVLAGCQSLVPAPAPARLELELIGQQILPGGFEYNATIVGGLSGIDYDPATGRYWAISDDRSETSPSRFYELTLDLAKFSKAAEPGHAAIAFQSVNTLKRADRSTFGNFKLDASAAADPESIRVHVPSGRLVWSSEGERNVSDGKPPILVDPHVWEMERDGRLVRALAIPEKFRASADNRGVRRNLAFEGLAFSPDYSTLYVATENALLQDGPVATLTGGSPSRIIEYDYPSGLVRAEYVYEVAPIPAAPARPDGWADNGISEILALGPNRLLVMERSYVSGVGNTIRLFEVDVDGATNVAGFDSLVGKIYTPLTKRLILDFATLKIRLDNLEGMTWGPKFADGSRSLVFVADDNFNAQQITQFLAFSVRER